MFNLQVIKEDEWLSRIPRFWSEDFDNHLLIKGQRNSLTGSQSERKVFRT